MQYFGIAKKNHLQFSHYYLWHIDILETLWSLTHGNKWDPLVPWLDPLLICQWSRNNSWKFPKPEATWPLDMWILSHGHGLRGQAFKTTPRSRSRVFGTSVHNTPGSILPIVEGDHSMKNIPKNLNPLTLWPIWCVRIWWRTTFLLLAKFHQKAKVRKSKFWKWGDSGGFQ